MRPKYHFVSKRPAELFSVASTSAQDFVFGLTEPPASCRLSCYNIFDLTFCLWSCFCLICNHHHRECCPILFQNCLQQKKKHKKTQRPQRLCFKFYLQLCNHTHRVTREQEYEPMTLPLYQQHNGRLLNSSCK